VFVGRRTTAQTENGVHGVADRGSESLSRDLWCYRRAMTSAGTVHESFAPIGSNLPDLDNYFCRDCRRIVHVRKGSPGFRVCPTPGCARQTGFGVYATTPRRGTRSAEVSASTARPRVR
jgi:hypothetical protein